MHICDPKAMAEAIIPGEYKHKCHIHGLNCLGLICRSMLCKALPSIISTHVSILERVDKICSEADPYTG